jgi:hypothetical protein
MMFLNVSEPWPSKWFSNFRILEGSFGGGVSPKVARYPLSINQKTIK